MINFANHKKIKKNNPEVYKDFFENNDLVISTDANFFWGGEYGVAETGPAVLNLFPRKVFLGVSKISEKNTFTESYLYYDNEKDKFIELSGDVFTGIYGQEKFNKYHEYLQKQGLNSGLKFNILTEIPLDTSSGLQGNLVYLLSLAGFLLTGKIKPADVKEWKSKDLPWRLSDKKFLDVLYFAWSFGNYFNGYPVSGVHSFVAALCDKEPVVFLKEGIIEPDFEKYANNKNIKFSGFKIPRPDKGLGFDVAVIFSGKTKKPGQDFLKTMARLKEREVTKDEFTKILAEDNEFLAGHCQNTSLKDNYIQSSKALSWEIASALKRVLEGDKNFESYLFTSISNYQSFLSLLGTLGEGEILNYVYGQLEELKINFKPTGSGGGGSLLLVDKYGELETKLLILEKKFREKGLTLEVYFFSNADGWAIDGPQVEQFLSQGIKAESLSGRIFKGIEYDCSKNTIEEVIVSDFEQLYKDREFVLDLDNKKIFIKGKKVTSDDLHSAKVAVDILEKLVVDDFHMITADKIVPSSYQDRYEIQSKIISPLIKLIKEKLNKKLPLEIKGESNKFNLKLGKANLKIVIGKEVV